MTGKRSWRRSGSAASYDTPQEAERAARIVLALLSAHLLGDVRTELFDRPTAGERP
ncbi:hypothetical protein [Kitasatospora cineracea]|uniref:hypothetical protein n=1 Tax=Kitasatospora cineracea TaxID=88074 RepID=UPI003F4D35FD